ncbi:MAG: DEAD/DEAH box helicase, partial [Gammaproteobacteria bacterium]|nr:DEAD/DEAH box helicase [Gammaproteobacteria bacterium]
VAQLIYATISTIKDYDANWDPLVSFFLAFLIYWVDNKEAKNHVSTLKTLQQKADESGYQWLAGELAELLSQLNQSRYARKAQAFRKKSGVHSIIDVSRPREAWETSLKTLINLSADTSRQKQGSGKDSRLVWLLELFQDGNCSIKPRVQKLSAAGKWSKGRAIAVKRLYNERDELDFLTFQDMKICAHIEKREERDYGYYYTTVYEFDPGSALMAMTGHSLLFLEESGVQVELVKGEPELQITKIKSGQMLLKFSPEPEQDREYMVIKESPTRIKIVSITEAHWRIVEALGSKGLTVPEAAKDQVLEAINAVSSMLTVHSDIGGEATGAEEVPSDATPHFHLLPHGDGLNISMLVQPFASDGPYYPPGAGGETVIAEIKGKRLQTKRELSEEKKQAKEAVAACPALVETEEKHGEWTLEEPGDCLETLLQLQDLGEKISIQWPEGEKFAIKRQVSASQFRMNIRQQQNWFAATGELALDEDTVLDMQHLLELLDETHGRFVQLEDVQYLALTETFRKRLNELKAYSEKHGDGVRFHPLAALALEEFTNEVDELKSDASWKKHLKRLREIEDLQPVLPSTFQGELRDYQEDGFNWLSRLAHWGVGACLADDMGLGKTIQALAAILARAPQGPSLIIAPTSVCMNWQTEARHFTPTLNVILFGSGDRQKTLDSLKPFDMLICSYGLLQQEQVAEMLAAVSFRTAVLDEAQAIKNMATKRSHAAMNLQAEFRLITTGTPIENHLGELWNLFRFINPGLLGSLERFNQKFAGPIEKFQDKPVRLQLKKLIRPFILRRLKSQVLEELPPRTEILLQVELSTEEMAFYEALRRQAVEKLARSDAKAGQKHLQILAEIMKLRRACCNTQLVTPGTCLPSSKLAVFGEVLEELLANKHKALVFSQFVGHLELIRAHLDKHAIHYQYLDGSTPAKERKKRVDAFQAGEGEVFLISLKAGGLGLNLTAADYVIHMDPWWNPAVEDQASDRAHRIGQQRPVTIYRLVAQHTIEEKIVALHHQKRGLADSLLEGADISGKMSAKALLRLLSDV